MMVGMVGIEMGIVDFQREVFQKDAPTYYYQNRFTFFLENEPAVITLIPEGLFILGRITSKVKNEDLTLMDFSGGAYEYTGCSDSRHQCRALDDVEFFRVFRAKGISLP
jgi:hypothetical protein